MNITPKYEPPEHVIRKIEIFKTLEEHLAKLYEKYKWFTADRLIKLRKKQHTWLSPQEVKNRKFVISRILGIYGIDVEALDRIEDKKPTSILTDVLYRGECASCGDHFESRDPKQKRCYECNCR